MDDHKLHGFKRQKLIASRFWRPAAEIGASSGHAPPESPRESPSLPLCSFWCSQHWLAPLGWVHLSVLCPLHVALFPVSVRPPQTVKTLVIGFSAQPKSRMSAIKILNYLQRTYFQIRSHSEVLSGCEFGGHCSTHCRSLSTCCIGALLRAGL